MPARVRLPLLLCALLSAVPAVAGGLVLGAHGGYGAYTQEDINGIIGLINARAGEEAIDEVKGGAEYGGHFGMRINETTILGVSYGRLRAATGGEAGPERLDVDAPADCWLAFVNWLPDSDKVGRLGLGADAGFITVAGRAEYRNVDGETTAETWEGDGLFLSVYVVGDATLTPGLSLLAHGGFRLAQVPGITVGGGSSGDDLDYSGIFVRVGLRFAP